MPLIRFKGGNLTLWKELPKQFFPLKENPFLAAIVSFLRRIQSPIILKPGGLGRSYQGSGKFGEGFVFLLLATTQFL